MDGKTLWDKKTGIMRVMDENRVRNRKYVEGIHLETKQKILNLII